MTKTKLCPRCDRGTLILLQTILTETNEIGVYECKICEFIDTDVTPKESDVDSIIKSLITKHHHYDDFETDEFLKELYEKVDITLK